MDDRIKWIEYKGYKILYSASAYYSESETIKLLYDLLVEQLKQPPGKLLMMFNVKEIHVTPKIKIAVEDCIKQCNAKGIIPIVANVGFNSLQKIILNVIKYNNKIFFAKTEEEGKKWLVRQMADK